MALTLPRAGARKVFLACSVLALLAACSSSHSSSAFLPGGDDAGGEFDSGGAPPGADAGVTTISNDAGVVTCSPANVQSYSPHWVPPRAHTSSCTAGQIESYAACLATNDPSSPACASWLGADAGTNSGCRVCFADSNDTDSSWGPIVDIESIRQINVSGCLALAGGDNGGSGCAGDFEALEGCEWAACATNCASASPLPEEFDSCVSAADTAGCSTYLSAAACVNDAGAASACFGPQNGTFAELFEAVATVFCLASDDAGSPSVDAGGGD